MKKIIAFIFLNLVLLTSCSTFSGSVEEKSQPAFDRLTNIPDDKCIVYVYRIPSMAGSAVTHNVKVFAKRESDFPPVGKYVYGYLHQESYIPLVLDADKLYRIHVGGLLYYKGKPGSECIFRVEGTERSFSCIAGGASSYFRRILSEDFEQEEIFSGKKELDKYSEESNSKYIEELSTMRLSSVIKPMIYK